VPISVVSKLGLVKADKRVNAARQQFGGNEGWRKVLSKVLPDGLGQGLDKSIVITVDLPPWVPLNHLSG